MGIARELRVTCECGSCAGMEIGKTELWVEAHGHTFSYSHLVNMSALDWIKVVEEGGDQVWVRRSLTDSMEEAVELKHMDPLKYKGLLPAGGAFNRVLERRRDESR